jgi:hypothetical protein
VEQPGASVWGLAIAVPHLQIGAAAPFAATAPGTPGTQQALTVTDTGQVPLVTSDLSVTGPDAGDFWATPGTCPTSLAPGATCQMSVGFLPKAAGQRTAALQIDSNDLANSPYSVPLSGTGTAAVTPPPPPPATVQLISCQTVTSRHARPRQMCMGQGRARDHAPDVTRRQERRNDHPGRRAVCHRC